MAVPNEQPQPDDDDLDWYGAWAAKAVVLEPRNAPMDLTEPLDHHAEGLVDKLIGLAGALG